MSANGSQEAGTPRQRRGPYVKGRSARGAQRGPHPPSPPGAEVLRLLEDLPREGRLWQTPAGMVLLDLQVLAKPSTAAMQDDWIHKVQGLLRKHGYEVREGLSEPQLPAVFYPPTPVGAHIALVASDEARERGVVQGALHTGRRLRFRVTRARVSFPRKGAHGTEAVFKVQGLGRRCRCGWWGSSWRK